MFIRAPPTQTAKLIDIDVHSIDHQNCATVETNHNNLIIANDKSSKRSGDNNNSNLNNSNDDVAADDRGSHFVGGDEEEEDTPHDDDDDKFESILFSSGNRSERESRWSRSSSVGGTILNDPVFKSDFATEYRLWSRVSEQKRRLTASFTASILSNIFGGQRTDQISPSSRSSSVTTKTSTDLFTSPFLSEKKAKSNFVLDNLLSLSLLSSPTDCADRNLVAPPQIAVQQQHYHHRAARRETSAMSKHDNERIMINLPLTTSNKMTPLGEHRQASCGETQRLFAPSQFNRDADYSDDYCEENEEDDDFDCDARYNRSSNLRTPTSGACNLGLYKGIFYSSMSSIFFSLSAVIVKYLKDIHPGQLAVCRFVGIFVLTIPMIVYHDLNPFGPPELRHLLILRGVAGATSLFLRFFAFRYLPIADASVIIFSIPVFVSIFAWIFLNEPCGLFQSFTIIIAMIGLMMTTKLPFLFGGGDSSLLVPSSSYYLYNSEPSFASSSNFSSFSNLSSLAGARRAISTLNVTHPSIQRILQHPIGGESARLNHFYGVLAAMSSLIFASSVFIFIRKAKGAHHAVIMFNFGWVAVIETAILTSILHGFSLPANPFEWYLIVILAVFSFCGQVLLTRSLQLEQAGPVSVVRATTDIALAFLWQIIIFRETPDLWSIFGALLVSSCILLTSLRKWVLSLPEHSWWKSKFHVLTM